MGLRRALFLGRFHPVKNLPALIEAWTLVRPEGWELVLAGADDSGHRDELERLVATLNVQTEIRFMGFLSPTEKQALLHDSDLFVLPSATENFGVAVAEALATGLPAIVSRGAPWDALERAGAGWWIEPTTEALARTLREATAMDDPARAEMGRRGREMAERDFAWEPIAERMLALYEQAAAGFVTPHR
jgi:glycosyltransferase involved in cell wall biosynthesis